MNLHRKENQTLCGRQDLLLSLIVFVVLSVNLLFKNPGCLPVVRILRIKVMFYFSRTKKK